MARQFATSTTCPAAGPAWNVVTSWDAFTGENFRRGGFLPQDKRYDRAREFLRRRPRAVRLLARRRDRRRQGHRAPSSPTRTPGAFAVHDDAVRHRGPVQRAPQPAGPPGDLPGRRLRRGPRVRRRRRRRDLHPARHAGGRARPSTPTSRAGSPSYGRSPDDLKILPGGDVRARRHRRRGRRSRPTTSAASRSAAQTAIKFAEQLWNRDLSDYDPDGPLPADRPGRRREHDLQGPGQRADVPRPASPPRTSGARSPRRRTSRCARSSSR